MPRPAARAGDTPISQLPYLPGLDGLRALAVAAVIVYHGNHAWLPGGFLGVEVFFVISGYLITMLLLGEHERIGRVSLLGFWRRRFRRLLPALYLAMGLVAVYLAVAFRSAQGRTRGDFIAGMTYSTNWYQIWVGQAYTAAEDFVPLRHLWSLAVEEQFYLVWPLVVIVLLRLGRRRLPAVGIGLVGVSLALAVTTAVLFRAGDVAVTCPVGGGNGYATVFGRCLNVNEALYLNSFTRASGILLGAGLALLWRPQAIMRGPLRRRGRLLDVVALLGLGGLAVLAWRIFLAEPGVDYGTRYDPWLFRGGLFAVGVATSAIIAAVVHARAWSNSVFGVAPLRWIGQRSYGLYLYHWPVFQILRRGRAPEMPWDRFAVGVAITVAIAAASYRFVEQPIRHGRLRQWLHGDRRPRTDRARGRYRLLLGSLSGVIGVIAAAGVSIAVAPNRCVGAVECDNVAGQAVVPATLPDLAPTSHGSISPSLSTTTTAAPARTDATDAGGATTPPTTAVRSPSTTTSTTSTTSAASATTPDVSADRSLPPADAPVIAIGESVMLGAAPKLFAGKIWVDAATSRQGTDVAALIERHVASGKELPPVMVIQTGTNGTVSQATFDRIMAQLPASRVPWVYFLTIKAPRSWTAGNNERIRALPSRYPNVRIIDWEQVGSTIEDELSRSDGRIHLRTDRAKQVYANMVFQALGRPVAP